METLIVRTDKQKLKAVKEVLNNMNIPFEITSDRMYNQAFEDKLRKSDEAFAKGEFTVITLENLWK
jgi:flagellar biosynthesis/type III secretory pathway M-ring protein FliF/YscJ